MPELKANIHNNSNTNKSYGVFKIVVRIFYSKLNSSRNSRASSRFRSSRPGRSVKKVFLKISQNSQENTCARVSFLIKLRASGLQLC